MVIARQPFVENGYLSLRFPNKVKVNIQEHWTRVTRFNPLWVSDDTSWSSYSPSSHRPPRAFYFSIIAIFIGIPSRSFCGGESVQTASLTSKGFCVLVTANSCGFRVSFLIVWARFCFNYCSFLCPFSPTFIPLSVQQIIKEIGSLNPWTSINDFSFPGNHAQCRKNS